MSAVATAPKQQVNRSAAVTKAAATAIMPSRIAAPPGTVNAPRSELRVSSPNDPAEREAEATAERVMNMPAPKDAGANAIEKPGSKAMRSPHVARMAGAIVQRESAMQHLLRTHIPIAVANNPIVQRESNHIASPREGQPNVSANLAAEIRGAKSAGNPLPPSVRRFMEQRLNADFSEVRVHTDEKAAQRNTELNARAFTVGSDIHFGAGEFQPGTAQGKQLLAHELTHTIQQGAAPQAPAPAAAPVARAVAVRETPKVQRGWTDYLPSLPDPREYIAGKAANIPGFTLFTVVIGFNPITNASVDRSAGNILRGAIELIPGGTYITDALNNHGIFDKVSSWVQTQFDAIKDIGSGIWDAITEFIGGISLTDLGDIGELWDRGKRIITEPVDRAINFAIALKDGIVQLIKDSILKPIGAFARTTSGYPLLCAIMGSDPITGEAAPQDAESVMGAFLTFVGQGELWAQMQSAKAVPRAFAWFNGAIDALKGFVAEIPGLFVTAFTSLEIMDIILIPRAFAKLANIFGGFAGRFISWGAKAAWDLLEIIFDVVKPGIMGYVKRTGAALKSILKNPLPFVGNLVAAGKLGFQQFAGNIGKHLKAALLEWLQGVLPGVYIPAALEFKEILKFVLSVLGLTWANMRGKLVAVMGETPVKLLEEGFNVVVTLVKDGPVAAWEQLKASLGNLRDMAIGALTDFVVDMVVTKALPKIVAMFIPGAGFIGAIISIYDVIMVFVQKMTKIGQVIGAFVNSIVQIAAGNIGAAAKRVESVMAGMLSLAISFLAGFAGFNKIGDKIMGVIKKIRAPIDKAIDGAINWIVGIGKAFLGKAKAAVKSLFSWAKAKKGFSGKGESHNVLIQGDEDAQLMVASSPTKAGIWIDNYVKEKGATFATDNAAKISAAKGMVGPAEAAVKAAATARRAAKKAGNPDDPALQPLLAAVTTANGNLATALGALLDVEGIVGPLGVERRQLSWQPKVKAHFDSELQKLLAAQQKTPQFNKDGSPSYIAAEIDIRHKVSAKDMIQNTNNTLQPKKLPDAVTVLKGFQGGNYYSGDPKKPERPGILKGAKDFLLNMYNDVANLFLGDMKINRRLGRRYDPGDGGNARAQQHVQYRANFQIKWGFKDDMRITIDMQDKNTPIQESSADRAAALAPPAAPAAPASPASK